MYVPLVSRCIIRCLYDVSSLWIILSCLRICHCRFLRQRALQGSYNAITVRFDSDKSYRRSFSDARTVGTEIGLAASNLISLGNSTASRLYCVGYSLGAHICGHAGKKMKLGRITG